MTKDSLDLGQSQKKTPGWVEPGGVNQGASTIHLFWGRASISGNVGNQVAKITLTLTPARSLVPGHLSFNKGKRTIH